MRQGMLIKDPKQILKLKMIISSVLKFAHIVDCLICIKECCVHCIVIANDRGMG